jgi:hypothetical protein
MFVTSDTPLYKHVVGFIHHIWKSKDYFPGPQPISIEYKHFPILKNNDYVVCEKTDGERHMLVALKFQGRNICLFVNRSFKMFEIKVNLKKKAYDGTILDGELYENDYMIYDAAIVNGCYVGEYHLDERLVHIGSLLKGVIIMKNDQYKLRLKKFFSLKDFKTFMDDHLPRVTQNIDGVVFTPVKEPIRIGTHETLFKWKPLEKNTVDFSMKLGRSFEGIGKPGVPVWKLYVQEKGKLFYESEFPLTKMNESWFEDGAIVECMYITWEDGPLWWKPVKRRHDKNYPNNRRTFYRTIVNIQENIQLKEFLDCI